LEASSYLEHLEDLVAYLEAQAVLEASSFLEHREGRVVWVAEA